MTARVDRLCNAAARLTTPELHDLAARIAALIEDGEKSPEPLKNPNRLVIEERRTLSATLRLEFVICGKLACKRCTGRSPHGPYWYAYWKQVGHSRSRYIGKELPKAS